MGKIKANDLTIWWEGIAVAYATTAELDVTADVYEVGSATSGAWRKYKRGRMGWTVSAGYLMDIRPTSESGTVNPLAYIKSGEEVPVTFGTMVRANGEAIDAKEQQPSTDWYYSGMVIVNRCTVSAVKGQIATRQFSATGVGELTEYRKMSTAAIYAVMDAACVDIMGYHLRDGLRMDAIILDEFDTGISNSALYMSNVNAALGTNVEWYSIKKKKPWEAAAYLHGVVPVESV